MNFTLQRNAPEVDGVFGTLIFGDDSLCTLENPAYLIPAGTYDLSVSYSPHFEEPLPILLNVPGRTEIRSHWGSFQENSKGCILVGESTELFGKNRGGIVDTRIAVNQVMRAINSDINPSSITIIDAPAEAA